MLTIKKYDRIKAVKYAKEYALSKNPAFFDYSNSGGNCTNYCSQCLYAGCEKMNFDTKNPWYYLSPANTSISWANVEPLYNFLTTNEGVGPFGKQSPLETCELGDLIQLKFHNKTVYSHCLVITEIKDRTPNGIMVSANSRDILNKPLTYYRYEKMRLIHILGYREDI